MRRGISFEIPNDYGRFLGDVLQPIEINAFHWKIGIGESYKIVNDKLDGMLFPDSQESISGTELKTTLESNDYYVIFADLQAYPSKEISSIETYEEFMESDCELVLLVVDCSYVTIYCKNQEAIISLQKNALNNGFTDIEYITDENDSRTRLSVW